MKTQEELNNKLISAVEANDTKRVKILLLCGADANAENWKPLEIASKNDCEMMVKILLDVMADAHANYDEALRASIDNGDNNLIEYLLDYGANIDLLHLQSSKGNVSKANLRLIEAAQRGSIESIKECLCDGAEIEAYNYCAFRCAASRGNTNAVEFLISCGADVRARDCFAEKQAEKNGHAETLDVIKEHKKKLEEESKEAEQRYRYAVMGFAKEVSAILQEEHDDDDMFEVVGNIYEHKELLYGDSL